MARILKQRQETKSELVAALVGLSASEVQVVEDADGYTINRVRWVQGPDANHWENGKVVRQEPTWYMEAEDLVLTPGQLTAVKNALEL